MGSTHPCAMASMPGEEAGQGMARGRPSQVMPGPEVVDVFVLSALSAARDAVHWSGQLDLQADPEVFHQLRVALRRMRSLWWAYGPLLDEGDAADWRGQFETLADIAGKTRDWDILQGLLTEFESAKGAGKALQMFVDARRSEAALASCEAIRRVDVRQMLDRAVDSAQRQLTASAGKSAAADFMRNRVRAAQRVLNKRLRRATSGGEPSYAALHGVRIAGKRLRYLLEFFAPVFEAEHREMIERMKAVQDELGQLNDVVASEALLREYAPPQGQGEIRDEAIRYLHGQKKRRMRRAYRMLRRYR